MENYINSLLEKRQFELMDTNTGYVNFYSKTENHNSEMDTAKVCIVVNNARHHTVSMERVIEMVKNMERDLYLKGFRYVNIMLLVLTDRPELETQCDFTGISCWIIDTHNRKLMIFENQPDDYEAMRQPLEYELQYGHRKQLVPGRKKSRLYQYPYVTIFLIFINVVVLLALEYFGNIDNVTYLYEHGAAEWYAVFELGEYYRLFTCMFVHFGMEHLISNMLMLAVLGSSLEPKMGSLQFLITYIVSGLCASLGSCLWYRYLGESVVSAGASGAIFGILGAMVVLVILNRDRMDRVFINRVVIIAVLLIVDGFFSEEVDYTAHLAGMIAGSVITLLGHLAAKVLNKNGGK